LDEAKLGEQFRTIERKLLTLVNRFAPPPARGRARAREKGDRPWRAASPRRENLAPGAYC
jgi:hypothetical protein